MTREEAIIILGNIPIDGKDKCYSIAEYQEAKTMAIEALEQEPRKGHWKVVPFNSQHGEYRPRKYACSECGWTIDLCRGLQQDTGHRLFCEHCGAKMESKS